MDPAMINAYLQKRGASPSAENANRVRQHYAANPDQLDRAAMGLPPGLEDRVAPTLDMILDQHIAQTALPPPPNASLPEANSTTGDANPAPAPSKRGPSTQTMPGASRQGGYGPGPSPSRQGGYGPANNATASSTLDANGIPVPNVPAGSDDGGILKWLLPILGISAAVPAAENMRGRMPSGPMSLAPPGSPLALPSPQQRITSQVGPNMESVGAEMDTINNRNASATAGRERQLRSEVDAENDSMMRQMEEQERARRGQKRTRELGDAAKRATGRR